MAKCERFFSKLLDSGKKVLTFVLSLRIEILNFCEYIQKGEKKCYKTVYNMMLYYKTEYVRNHDK